MEEQITVLTDCARLQGYRITVTVQRLLQGGLMLGSNLKSLLVRNCFRRRVMITRSWSQHHQM